MKVRVRAIDKGFLKVTSWVKSSQEADGNNTNIFLFELFWVEMQIYFLCGIEDYNN